jgi:H+/Cl- antiporter ClcA
MDSDDWHKQKTYESMITYGANAIKYVLISNGGAIISILTFLGHFPNKIGNITDTLICLLLGFVFGMIANITVYFVQHRLYNEDNKYQGYLFITLCLIIVGTILFCIGCFNAVHSLQHF